MFALNSTPRVSALSFDPTDRVPNSSLPVVVYRRAFSLSSVPTKPELAKMMAPYLGRNGWRLDWLDSDAVYRYTHYHSTAHEVLAVVDEVAAIRLGGTQSREVIHVGPGDLVAIPAGVGHRRISGGKDFCVAGLYPEDQQWDLLRATKADCAKAQANLGKVALPKADPFYGLGGPLMQHWQ